jgi:hypothetical protein
LATFQTDWDGPLAGWAFARSPLFTGSVFLFMAVHKQPESWADFAFKRKFRP